MEDSGSSLGRLLVFAVLVGLSALFTFAQLVLFRANRQRLRQMAEQGHFGATVALRLLERPSQLTGALRAGVVLCDVGATAVLTTFLLDRLSGWGGWAAWALASAALLVLARALPRAVAARAGEGTAVWCAIPAQVASWVLTPAVAAAGAVAHMAGRLFGVRVRWDHALVPEDELRLLVRMGEMDGTLEEGEREMIHSIFQFGETLVREIMVPRVDIRAVRDDARLPEILDLVLEEGHSRIPVYQGTIDHVVGVVHVKDLFPYLRDGRTDVAAAEVMRPAYYVPETKKVDELFQEMRQKKVHLAIVVDEYGGTAGLVTIEDVLEEIVGEIRDEYDVEEHEPIVMLDERTALVDARTHLEEVNERLGLDLPVGEVDTLGGFVYSRVGHVPALGEQVTHNGVVIRVEELEGQRIARLRVEKQAPEGNRPPQATSSA